MWSITGGGAIFAALPLVYAAAFSGFYWAMMALLWALFFARSDSNFAANLRTRAGAKRGTGIWDSTSSQFTLGLMFWAAVIFMPIVVFTRGGHTA